MLTPEGRVYLGLEDLKEPPMTVIVGVRENDDCILLASDRGIQDFGGLRDILPYVKLNKLERATIAWGCSGNGTLGEEFSKWLMGQVAPLTSWKQLQDMVVNKLAELNGTQRAITRRAGVEPTPDHLVSCLLAGWVDNQPGIFEFDDQGRFATYWAQGFYAIGSGSAVAAIAARTLRQIKASGIDKLRLLMDVVVKTARGCEPPITIWRLRAGDITEVTSGQEGKEAGNPYQT